MKDNGNKLKQNDQIRLLEVCNKFTDTKDWEGIFTYPNCGHDLLLQGLVAKDGKITNAGKAALWFLDKGSDPTGSKAVETFSLNMNKQ